MIKDGFDCLYTGGGYLSRNGVRAGRRHHALVASNPNTGLSPAMQYIDGAAGIHGYRPFACTGRSGRVPRMHHGNEEGHEDDDVPGDQEVRGAPTAPTHQHDRREVGSVDRPGDEAREETGVEVPGRPP